MSTNIHAHVELKIGGEWQHYQVANDSGRQWYLAYAELAGVRVDGTTDRICQRMGEIPPDPTKITQLDLDYWEGDGHHYGWINAEEFGQWRDKVLNIAKDSPVLDLHKSDLWFDTVFGYFFGNTYEGWKKYPEDLNEQTLQVQDIRIIFWFDN